jgi:RNA methyltransferase, TrmH family
MIVRDALASGVSISEVFVRTEDEVAAKVGGECEAAGASVLTVGDNVLRLLTDTTSSQGVVAVAEMPRFEIAGLPAAASLVLVLDQVRDPGNAGTLVRSAAASGADCVVFAEGSVDPFGPKTVRASAGAVFSIPVARGGPAHDAIEVLRNKGFQTVAADGRAPTPVFDTDMTGSTAIILGNEAWGFGEGGASADRTASIPLAGGVESLNVGIAGSIFLFEAVRQRRLSSAPDG